MLQKQAGGCLDYSIIRFGLQRCSASADKLPQSSQEYFIIETLSSQTSSDEVPQNLLSTSSLVGLQRAPELYEVAPQF
jgi:hypothetical protein